MLDIDKARCPAGGRIAACPSGQWIVRRCLHAALKLDVAPCTGWMFIMPARHRMVYLAEITKADAATLLAQPHISAAAALALVGLTAWDAPCAR
ncbi:MAG TPA: hypothetical protein VF102_07160 [Gemmatimonadaceae bacterium]